MEEYASRLFSVDILYVGVNDQSFDILCSKNHSYMLILYDFSDNLWIEVCGWFLALHSATVYRSAIPNNSIFYPGSPAVKSIAQWVIYFALFTIFFVATTLDFVFHQIF